MGKSKPVIYFAQLHIITWCLRTHVCYLVTTVHVASNISTLVFLSSLILFYYLECVDIFLLKKNFHFNFSTFFLVTVYLHYIEISLQQHFNINLH